MTDVYQELLELDNVAVADMALKCEAVFSSHEKAHVGISGGADSDVMLDVCERVSERQPIEIRYEWCDTGVEWQATKDHLRYLEDNYGVTIHRVRADKTIPVCAKTYGQPFLSKMVSRHLGTLQRHGFRWDDKTLPVLKAMYPGVPQSTLKWWANEYMTKSGVASSYCIARNKLLKEFVTENPPWFPISDKCCTYAKKMPADRGAREHGCDVRLVGTRRSEGGGTLTRQLVLRQEGRRAGHVPPAVLAHGRRQGCVRGGVRHRPQRLLLVGLQQDWLRGVPAQPSRVR